MRDPHELKVFLARLIGWTSKGAVDRAFRSIELAVNYRAPLVLLGEGDLVPIAHALHRRTFGADQPFILCDPRRENTAESTRWPETYTSGVEAAAAAAGGSLCLCRSRLPSDLAAMVAQLRGTDNVLHILCSDRHEVRSFRMLPAPIEVPSLTDRANELPRIVDEYARDAIRLLDAPAMWFTDKERAWVIEGGVSSLSLSEIEIATVRLVALKMFDNKLDRAAQRLRIPQGALRKWLERRAPLPGDPDDEERAILVRDVEASFAEASFVEEGRASVRCDHGSPETGGNVLAHVGP